MGRLGCREDAPPRPDPRGPAGPGQVQRRPGAERSRWTLAQDSGRRRGRWGFEIQRSARAVSGGTVHPGPPPRGQGRKPSRKPAGRRWRQAGTLISRCLRGPWRRAGREHRAFSRAGSSPPCVCSSGSRRLWGCLLDLRFRPDRYKSGSRRESAGRKGGRARWVRAGSGSRWNEGTWHRQGACYPAVRPRRRALGPRRRPPKIPDHKPQTLTPTLINTGSAGRGTLASPLKNPEEAPRGTFLERQLERPAVRRVNLEATSRRPQGNLVTCGPEGKHRLAEVGTPWATSCLQGPLVLAPSSLPCEPLERDF
ncbi:tetraspanin-18 isoform X2 [Cavia porcellus]|uniref:tetraspanin-18 isoform X2 n=1 Tax=Cavia porcellus TaxID=10141 RepID=UPI002FE046A9